MGGVSGASVGWVVALASQTALLAMFSLLTLPPEMVMLRLALFFLVVSLVAALFGFTGISAATAGIAKVLFFLFIVGFLIVLFVGLMIGSAFW